MPKPKKKVLKCYWYVYIRDQILFILPNGDILTEGLIKLIEEEYRLKPYYRWPNTGSRIAQSTIKNNARRCHVLLASF